MNEGIKEGTPMKKLTHQFVANITKPPIILMRVPICMFLLEAVLSVHVNIGFTGIPIEENVQIEVLESFQMYCFPGLESWQLT